MESKPRAVEPSPEPRVPGWYLVGKANSGPQLWHLLRTTTPSGTALATCGLRGHVVAESEPIITRCPDCVAALAV